MLVKLINGVLQYAPRNLKENGKIIMNFNKDYELMRSRGFKELIDVRPSYDPLLQYLDIVEYEEEEDYIRVIYEVKELPPKVKTDLEKLAERVEEFEKFREIVEHVFNNIFKVTLDMSTTVPEEGGEEDGN